MVERALLGPYRSGLERTAETSGAGLNSSSYARGKFARRADTACRTPPTLLVKVGGRAGIFVESRKRVTAPLFLILSVHGWL